MSQIGPRGKKICPGQVLSDGQKDKQTDGLITIGCPQSGALICGLEPETEKIQDNIHLS